MKDWPWQKWVGKIILLVIAFAAFLVKEFGVAIPWWMIILPAATQVGQWFLALAPATPFVIVAGKLLLLVVAVVEIVLGGLGVQSQLWAVLAPLIGAIAQYLISMLPEPPLQPSG